jgi:hypothetical protein
LVFAAGLNLALGTHAIWKVSRKKNEKMSTLNKNRIANGLDIPYLRIGLYNTFELGKIGSPISVYYKKKENTKGVFWIFSDLCTMVPSSFFIRIFLYFTISLYEYYRLFFAIKAM